MRPRVKNLIMYARKVDVDTAIEQDTDDCTIVFLRKSPSPYQDDYKIYVGNLIPRTKRSCE